MKKFFKGFDFEHAPLPLKRVVNGFISFQLFRRSHKKIKIIGVTGTSGKTTTTTLLYRVSMALGHKAGLIGTVENFIGDKKVSDDFFNKGKVSLWEKIFFTESFTTPEVWNLHKLLSQMEKDGCEYVFMEVSSHGLEEKRMDKIMFTGAIYTNLSHDHLDFHKNMENYFLSKRRLFKILSEKAFALTNADSEYGLKMMENTKAQKFLYGFKDLPEVGLRGISPKSDFGEGKFFHGKIKKLDFSGLELDFNGEEIQSKLIGKFNAYNLLAVWSACKLLGFDMKKVKEILRDMKPPTGRFEHFMSGSRVLVIVDYAHKPDALSNVLRTIKEIKEKNSRVISIFGCGGDRDPSKRPVMGKIGVDLSDIAIFTSDNPRSEDPDKIIDQMKDNLSAEELGKVTTMANRREAILEAVKIARAGDIILVAGKGHEDYQEIKGVKNHFNDMEELKKAFR